MNIKVTYSSIDGVRKSESFRTIDVARLWAHHRVGKHPEIGSTYAISGDGIGKIVVSGCTLDDLFPDAEGDVDAKDYCSLL